VEATTLQQRVWKLLPQDQFLCDHIESRDILLVSIGGNDIALAPSPCTVCSMAGLISLPSSCIDHGGSQCVLPVRV